MVALYQGFVQEGVGRQVGLLVILSFISEGANATATCSLDSVADIVTSGTGLDTDVVAPVVWWSWCGISKAF